MISPLVGSDSDGVCLRVNLLNVVRILLNEDVSISLMNPVDEDKNAFDE